MNYTKKFDDFFTKICILIFFIFSLLLMIPVLSRIYVKVFDKSNSFIDFVFKDSPGMLPNKIESEKFNDENINFSLVSAEFEKSNSVKNHAEQNPQVGESLEKNDDVPSKENSILNAEISWTELYPFDINTQDSKSLTNITKNDESSIFFMFYKKITVKFDLIKDKILNWLDKFYFLKQDIVNIATKIEYLIKWNLQLEQKNSYSYFEILPNGHFTTFVPRTDTIYCANSVIKYNKFLKQNGMKLFYINAPFKYSSDETYGKNFCYVKENAKEFINYMNEENIPVLNLRKELYTDKKDFYDSFYKTDHHWNAETGLWATKKIAEFLNKNSDVKIDSSLYDNDNYQFKIYKNGYLGSFGRKATLSLATPDDFTLITPKFDTQFTVNISSTKKTNNYITGNIFDTIYAKDLVPSENNYNSSAYGAYSHGDTNLFIKNNKAINNYKILITSDSFSDVVIPFLSLGVKQVDRFDLRYFNGSLRKFIEQNGPYDAVLILLNESHFYANEEAIKLHDNHWNFD